MLCKSTDKANTFLRICPAIGDYLKGGKEKREMVTFQAVKQKSMDMKWVNIGGNFSLMALQKVFSAEFSEESFLLMLMVSFLFILI